MGPWFSGCVKPPPVPPRFVAVKDFYPWQAEMYAAYLQEPDDTGVYWIWDKKGGCGKTAFIRSLVGLHQGDVLIVGGKAADMTYAVCQYVQKNGHGPRAVVLNLTRSRQNFMSYEGIEQIKDGVFFSPKYESCMAFYNHPHIICLANWPPDVSMLSNHRWMIHEIVDKHAPLGMNVDLAEVLEMTRPVVTEAKPTWNSSLRGEENVDSEDERAAIHLAVTRSLLPPMHVSETDSEDDWFIKASRNVSDYMNEEYGYDDTTQEYVPAAAAVPKLTWEELRIYKKKQKAADVTAWMSNDEYHLLPKKK